MIIPRLEREIKRDIAIKVAWSFIGRWYKWGGDDPSGFDCSGFVIEILKSVGLLPRKYDGKAIDIFNYFNDRVVNYSYPGVLVFYGSPIHHVEFCIDDFLSIGASGGGSKTVTIEDAIKNNAFIKVRPILRKRQVFAYVDPFKGNF